MTRVSDWLERPATVAVVHPFHSFFTTGLPKASRAAKNTRAVRTDRRFDRFGPFVLDRDRRELSRDGRPLPLAARHVEVLLALTAEAGRIVAKDALVAAAWPDTAVSDDSIFRAINDLRHALGAQADGAPHIVTHKGRGYCFAAAVERGDASDAGDLDALLDPYVAFVEGRAALETLDRHQISRARDTFAAALRADDRQPSAHVGLATALMLQLEATRADANRDRDALATAEHHATEGCRLAPPSADAWSTLALVRHRRGRTVDAVAAARKAVALEPGEWRHHLRLGFVAGGAERLRAALQVLKVSPQNALAHWLASTVFVARQVFDLALEHVRAGCAAQDDQRPRPGHPHGLTAVGLHLLHGLVCAAQGDGDAARDALARELTFEDSGHIYARESSANAWYTRGALEWRDGQLAVARHAFDQALQRIPDHALASRALVALGCDRPIRQPEAADEPLATAIADAAADALRGRDEEAVRRCVEALALERAPGPGAAWIIPVEPLLHVAARREAWAPVLTLLHQRAS